MKLRVQVLAPWTHNGVEQPVGSFVELDEADVRLLRGAVSQEHIPEPPPAMPAPPAAPARSEET
ncbi:MAG TPA: hypothetical protein VJ890_28190 [Vineibacter sp.]|nr:hypothetical protein [Vineibacter sp.]